MRISSIQSLGCVDGPGIRYVVFSQGCNLRCKCCHNPETWDSEGGYDVEPEKIVNEMLKYKNYFGKEGGLTLSGGEPLLQTKSALELFRLAKLNGINTCLDTSGSILSDDLQELLLYTDLVMLDIKYTNKDDYTKYVGGNYETVCDFLRLLEKSNINTWIRQVLIPSINDSKDNFLKLKTIKNTFKVVSKVELLPFKNICENKYNELGLEFPFKEINMPNRELINWAEDIIKN